LAEAAPELVKVGALTQVYYIGEVLDVLLEDQEYSAVLDELLTGSVMAYPATQA
jgi:hypothetical protein